MVVAKYPSNRLEMIRVDILLEKGSKKCVK